MYEYVCTTPVRTAHNTSSEKNPVHVVNNNKPNTFPYSGPSSGNTYIYICTSKYTCLNFANILPHHTEGPTGTKI